MPFHFPSSQTLDWFDVAPSIYEIHDLSLDPYMMRWPRLAWRALEKAGLTDAASEADRLDTILRAMSVTLLYVQFLDCLRSDVSDEDFAERLGKIITWDQIACVLAQKYGDSPAGERMDDAFDAINWYHLPQLVNALHGYFGSYLATFDSLVETAVDPGDHEPGFLQLACAHEFLWGVFDDFGDEKMGDELHGSSQQSIHRPPNKLH
jgi:hypothetical protein